MDTKAGQKKGTHRPQDRKADLPEQRMENPNTHKDGAKDRRTKATLEDTQGSRNQKREDRRTKKEKNHIQNPKQENAPGKQEHQQKAGGLPPGPEKTNHRKRETERQLTTANERPHQIR